MQGYRAQWSEIELLPPMQRLDVSKYDTVARRCLADGVSGVARGEVAVVFLDLTRIGVPERLRYHQERSAIHHGVRGERVPGRVEVNRGTDASPL